MTAEKTAAVTPMMQQFLAIKEQHPDAILFYRMGDFYEMFFDDAVTAAKVLDISLTKRGKHENAEIPMCGVPHHSHEPYLQKLILSGYKVAICEQMEKPEEAKKRGYKAVVRREVVRIVTPGTILEDVLLDARESNYLAALSSLGNDMALAWIDISTGEFRTCLTSKSSLSSDLSRLNAKELLLADKLFIDQGLSPILREHKAALTPQAASMFDSGKCENKLKTFFEVNSLEGFGNFSRAEISACGSLIEYIDITQKGNLPRLAPPLQFSNKNFMEIDGATRRNLEIYQSLSGNKKGSLLSVIDKTITACGSRLLLSYINSPLAHASGINRRLDMVQFFFDNDELCLPLSDIFKQIPDFERALSRICIGKAGPKDLNSIKDGLANSMILAEIIEFSGATQIPQNILGFLKNLGSHDQLITKLKEALKDEVGVLARDGGYVADGYHAGLDELRGLRNNSRDKIIELRDKYRSETGVNTLKITQNNVLGYFVEVTPSHSSKITDEKFVHRQTLASAVRYTTIELRQLESDIINAKDQALKLELMIFEELVNDIVAAADKISSTSTAVAAIDVMSSFASFAAANNCSRPIVDDSLEFSITGARHPVVEANLSDDLEGNFIANDCDLSQKQRLWLLTGPNMAGKSTYLRQNAIIAILAQIGSFVPAAKAHIGTVDKLFSRVGASDDLARGRSTFMVEMVETATILNQASNRSLVILDEIGRGTATYDGLSIAWAVVEHVHDKNKCRALFATHYHELTCLTAKLSSLACYSMRVKEWEGKVIFLHEVVKGAADRSYGIHVAKLAGLPNSVIKRADEVLTVLQQSETGKAKIKLVDDLPLFSIANIANQDKAPSKTEEALKAADLDELSPRDALDLLYKLKGMINHS